MASKMNFVANGSPKKPKVIDPKEPLHPIVREQILQDILANPAVTHIELQKKYGLSGKYVARISMTAEFKARMKYLTNKNAKTAIWDRETLFNKAQDLYVKTKSDNVKTKILATLGKWSGIESSTINHEFADMQRIQLTLNSTNANIPIPEKTDEILSDTGNTDV